MKRILPLLLVVLLVLPMTALAAEEKLPRLDFPANNYVGYLDCPNGKRYVLPNSPVTFFGTDPIKSTHAGGIGCDTSAVLSECGYTPEQIQSLIDRGIATGK